MSWFRFKAGFMKSTNPAITFTSVDNVLSHALMLLEKWGSQDSFDRLDSLVYSYLIYDNFAAELKHQQGGTGTQLDSWKSLFQVPKINDQYKSSLSSQYHGCRIGDTKFQLPLSALDPNLAGKVRPTSMKTLAPAEYEVRSLSDDDFIEAEYQVRCNLLHGSYDIRKDDIATIVMRAGVPFVPLVSWMVRNTK